MLINPLFFQDILCSIVNVDPQTHVVGKFANGANYMVILYCPKNVAFWDQIRFPPFEAPITNSILPFLSLCHPGFFDFL